MSAKDIFEIEVLGWEKHMGSLKKNHPYFMISKRLMDHHKISNLTTSERLLLVILIGRCADEYSKQIRCSREWVKKQIGSSKEAVEKQLDSLQQNQLVRYSKQLSNRREEKRKEENRSTSAIIPKKSKVEKSEKKTAELTIVNQPPKNEVIKFYCEQWKLKYGANPPIDGKTAGQLTRLVKDFGLPRSIAIIQNYLKMTDQWFIKKRHDVGTMITNLNAIAQYSATGKDEAANLKDHKDAEFYGKLFDDEKKQEEIFLLDEVKND